MDNIKRYQELYEDFYGKYLLKKKKKICGRYCVLEGRDDLSYEEDIELDILREMVKKRLSILERVGLHILMELALKYNQKHCPDFEIERVKRRLNKYDISVLD